MIDLSDDMLPGEVAQALANRVRARRVEHRLTQADLARQSGVSLGSFKRFEQMHEISLTSLINISFALGCESDFATLFAQPYYETIDDAIRGNRANENGKAVRAVPHREGDS
jgi:transcriptional regulator with XRE-family HTH domain